MRQHAEGFVGAAFDTMEGAGDAVTVAVGGMSAHGPWAGRANAARNEESSFLAYLF